MTTLPKQPPRPIREETWHEVRCPRCGWHIVDAAAGSKIRKSCPKCRTEVIREIPARKAA